MGQSPPAVYESQTPLPLSPKENSGCDYSGGLSPFPALLVTSKTKVLFAEAKKPQNKAA